MADKGKELLRLEAFENYYAQGLTGERSLKATATALSIPLSKVKKWHAADLWEEHILERNEAVAKEVDERVVEKVAEVKAEYHNMTRNIIRKWFSTHFGMDENAALMIATMDAETIIKLVKLDLVLMGAPDAIKQIEKNVTVGVEERMSELSTEDLKAIIEKRRALPPAVTITAEKVEEPSGI